MVNDKIQVSRSELSAFCRKHRIRRLAFFGSVLRDDFGPESDVDVLVEFDPNAKIGLIIFARIEIELGKIIGRKVDLNTEGFISKYFRDRVLSEAEEVYVAA
jgi:predicted nucleotidyltransferase